MERLVRDAQIWDLHIHTPLGTPTQTNYNGDSSITFVEKVIKIYDELSSKIGMISFTDHNLINVSVYTLFREKSNICLIPGIELDVYLSKDDTTAKHIIFYFDEKELDTLDELNCIIKNYISENKMLIFDHFIIHLISKEKKFVISPHAFKQGKRAINSEWVEDFSAKKGIKKFIGSFFVFWEASGQSEICRAIDFLNDYYQGSNHKVIAFSDSSTYDNIKKYASNPDQYFLCLNTFKGLLLAGSDNDRIIYTKDDRLDQNPSGKLKKISIKTNFINKNTSKIDIEFSDRLNAIIGGRGQGKSAFLDTLVYGIDENLVKSKRRNFVKKFEPQIINFRNNELMAGTKVIYFSQSHINELFDGKSQDNLVDFFKDEFVRFSNLSANIADIIAEYSDESLRNFEFGSDCNITDDLANLKIIEKSKKQIVVKKENQKILEYHTNGDNFIKKVKAILPLQKEIWDEELEKLLQAFIYKLLLNIARYNLQQIYEKKYTQLIKKQIDLLIKKKSTKERKKADSITNLSSKLQYIYNKELKKICIINNMYSFPEKSTRIKFESINYKGEENNIFYFVVGINKEHPVEFARRLIIESINAAKCKNPELKTNKEIFTLFAVDNKLGSLLKEAYSSDTLANDIKAFKNFKCIRFERIIYKCNKDYFNLHDVSPGTQTNAIMEYLLHSDSTFPLLIDQPEDNIDNEARFSKLTKWIRTQKYNRQIILVTHDANIVINGDAECVIVASHDGNQFNYNYGALEYEDILDEAAVILDGGKYAVHRRITKYGE